MFSIEKRSIFLKNAEVERGVREKGGQVLKCEELLLS